MTTLQKVDLVAYLNNEDNYTANGHVVSFINAHNTELFFKLMRDSQNRPLLIEANAAGLNNLAGEISQQLDSNKIKIIDWASLQRSIMLAENPLNFPQRVYMTQTDLENLSLHEIEKNHQHLIDLQQKTKPFAEAAAIAHKENTQGLRRFSLFSREKKTDTSQEVDIHLKSNKLK